MTASGVPKTWFNTCEPGQAGFDGGRCHPDPEVLGQLAWRRDSPYAGHLRIMSEGCQGALMAYQVLAEQGRKKPEWLAFATKYGDFLLSVQDSEDGPFLKYK